MWLTVSKALAKSKKIQQAIFLSVGNYFFGKTEKEVGADTVFIDQQNSLLLLDYSIVVFVLYEVATFLSEHSGSVVFQFYLREISELDIPRPSPDIICKTSKFCFYV